MRAVLCVGLLILGCSSERATVAISGDLPTTTTTSTTTTSTTTSAPVLVPTVVERSTTTTSTTTTVAPTTTTSTTTTVPPPTTLAVHKTPGPTLAELVDLHFHPDDRAWALRVAFCESSASGKETFSSAINPSSGSAGWFQHLPKFWQERSSAAGIPGASILDPTANVAVAAWLVYEGGGTSHWYPSEHCWGRTGTTG